MQVMVERDRNRPLSGLVELDDAYLGGERSGGKRGRGAAGKTPFVAAMQTTGEGYPVRVKLTVVKGFRKSEIASWADRHLVEGSRVVSDGLACFGAIAEAGCRHDSVVCGGGGESAVLLGEHRPWQSEKLLAKHLSFLSTEVRATLLVGVRVSFQSPL